MRKLVKKQQSQETIQSTVPSRNVTQVNGDVSNYGKAVTGFAVNACLVTFVICQDRNQENVCLENDCRFVFEHFDIV